VRISVLPAAAVVAAAGCGYKAPTPPAPRDAMEVSASFGRTWDAVIDEFADRNIPIRTIERASGLIATELLTISHDARSEADCGTLNGRMLPPTHAIYNVLVRGDSARATVKATMRWVRVNKDVSITCETTHRWEGALEERVKGRAERPILYRPLADAPRESAVVAVAGAAPAPARDSVSVQRPPVHFTCDNRSSAPLDNPEDEYRRQRVEALRRLGVVECLEQLPPNLVRVMVGPRFRSISQSERDDRFERLRGSYGSWGPIFMELWTRSGKFAEYGRRGYRENNTPRLPGATEDASP
jgi:hypothetical protein